MRGRWNKAVCYLASMLGKYQASLLQTSTYPSTCPPTYFRQPTKFLGIGPGIAGWHAQDMSSSSADVPRVPTYILPD